jgi:two-component system sensor histidine kinase UhpB
VSRSEHAQPRRRLSLFWRVFATNAAVLTIAGATLSLSPASIPAPSSLEEIVVLLTGLAVMLVVNLLLLRRTFSPLARLTGLMRRVNLLHPGDRIPIYGEDAEVVELTEAFNQMLDRLEAERRESARSTLAGQEAERQRLARELHDEISQTLTALLLQLGRAAKNAPSDIRNDLTGAQEAARASLDEVQRIVRELRPETLDDLGLATALGVLSERVTEHTGIRVARKLDHDLPALTPEEELVAYRIAQESLTNVVKHAHASQAELRLERTPAGVTLSIRDDGRGLDGQLIVEKGIRGMRERALLIGARLTIDSPKAGGVQVRLSLPRDESGR